MTWTGTGDSRQWRVPLAIQIVPAITLGSMIYLFPEVCLDAPLVCLKRSMLTDTFVRAPVGCAIMIEQMKACKILLTYMRTVI